MATQKTDVLRYKVDQEKLWGIYRGIVEDRFDPLRLGRVRVRVWGVHTEEQAGDLNQVPWEELVWAHPVLSTFGGSISDIGAWYVPVQGTHVFVFFENGNMMQPRYFASAPGFPIDGAKYSQLEKQDGFVDPEQWYPLDDHIEEHDWHRLARVMRLGETYIELKKNNLDDGVEVAFGGSWDEQPPMYETEYPFSNVFATEGEFDENQVFEFDGTQEKQRLQYWHPSYSYFEINKDGRFVLRNAHHRWDICDMDKHMHTMGNIYEKVDEAKTCLVWGDEWREIEDNRWTKIAVDDWREVGSANYLHVKDEDYKKVDSNQHYIVEGTYLEKISEDKYVTVVGDYNIEVQSSIYEASLADMLTLIGGRCALTIGEDYLIYADSGIGITSPSPIDICGDHVAIGNTEVYIGADVYIGPTVHLGVDAAVASCVQGEEPTSPEVPDPPIAPADPPVPEIPPEFPPPEIEVEMPTPGC